MARKGKDLRIILGLGLTLDEYEAELLHSRPYYDEAPLHFECTHCGHCCSRPGVVVFSASDLSRLASHLCTTIGDVREGFFNGAQDPIITVDDDHGCPFHVDERCTIHSAKPTQCATYPFWPEIVGTAEAWTHERSECEGIGRGKPYSAADIRLLLLRDASDPD
jgi:Fe-S-cluster containining protein